MLTSMSTNLKGKVFKIENYDKKETSYTIILGKRILFPWQYKTATLYKRWEESFPNLRIEINRRDSTKYGEKSRKNEIFEPGYIDLEELVQYIEKLPGEERGYLRKNIENIPEKIRGTLNTLFHESLFPNKNLSYGFEMQKVNNISEVGKKEDKNPKKDIKRISNLLLEKIYNKVYKKAFVITNMFPL